MMGWSLSRRARLAGAAIAALLPVLALAPRLLAADPDALWNIVHGRCVPNAERGAGPAPCSLVDLAGGYAVLKDIRGRPSSC